MGDATATLDGIKYIKFGGTWYIDGGEGKIETLGTVSNPPSTTLLDKLSIQQAAQQAAAQQVAAQESPGQVKTQTPPPAAPVPGLQAAADIDYLSPEQIDTFTQLIKDSPKGWEGSIKTIKDVYPDIFGDIGTDGKVIPKAYVGSLVFGYNECGDHHGPLTGLVIEGDSRHFLDPPEEE